MCAFKTKYIIPFNINKKIKQQDDLHLSSDSVSSLPDPDVGPSECRLGGK